MANENFGWIHSPMRFLGCLVQEEGSSFYFIYFNFILISVLKNILICFYKRKFSKEGKKNPTMATLCILSCFTDTKGCSPLLQGQHWWLKKNLTNDYLKQNKTKQKDTKTNQMDLIMAHWPCGTASPALASDPKLNWLFLFWDRAFGIEPSLTSYPEEVGGGTPWLGHHVSSLFAGKSQGP